MTHSIASAIASGLKRAARLILAMSHREISPLFHASRAAAFTAFLKPLGALAATLLAIKLALNKNRDSYKPEHFKL
jgi:hypothetical protein